MSGLALLYSRDGSPLEPALLSRLVEPLLHRGPDGLDRIVQGEIGLAHLHFWTTPEELGERQPISTPELHLVWDGRLDNRDELIPELGLQGTEASEISDARLALSAYERWEERCCDHLLGPFALAIYDRRRRRLFCGRDALGQRTLFYALTPRLFAAASEEAALLALPGVSRRLDEVTVARYFAVESPLPGSTFFTDVRELPAAHVLAVDEHELRLRGYWEPDPEPTIRYRNDREYVEAYLELLRRSVRCRLRSTTPSMVMMSGGMDSTSVAALAASEPSSRSRGLLRTISWVFDELAELDERRYIDPVVKHLGLESVRVCGDGAWPLRDLATWPRNPSTPLEGPYRRLRDAVYATARDAGVRTLLTGEYGDELYFGGEFWLTDLVREGRRLEGARLWLEQAWWQYARRSRVWYGALGSLARVAGWKGTAENRPRDREWLTAHARELVADAQPPSVALARRRGQHAAVLDGAAAQSCPIAAGHASRTSIELRRPYRDRRVVEFALGVPAHLLYRPRSSKFILRESMRGLLPEEVRQRLGPTPLSPLFRRGVVERELPAAQALLARGDALWRRFVKPDWIAGAFPARIRDGEGGAAGVAVWRCLCWELFPLRTGAALQNLSVANYHP